MAEVIRLVGVEQAKRCLAAARKAETLTEVDAWLRLHSRYMRKVEIARTQVGKPASAQVVRTREAV